MQKGLFKKKKLSSSVQFELKEKRRGRKASVMVSNKDEKVMTTDKIMKTDEEMLQELQNKMSTEAFNEFTDMMLKGSSERFKTNILSLAIDYPEKMEKLIFGEMSSNDVHIFRKKLNLSVDTRSEEEKLEDIRIFNKEAKNYASEIKN